MALFGRAVREQKSDYYKYNLGKKEDLAFSNSKVPPGWNGENVGWRVWNRRPTIAPHHGGPRGEAGPDDCGQA
eukprot:14227137-Heterocapsa_arctica.AAC.1